MRRLIESGIWKAPWLSPGVLLGVTVQLQPRDWSSFETACQYLSHCVNCKEDQGRLLFAVMDSDGSGTLDGEEFAKLLSICIRRAPAEPPPSTEMYGRLVDTAEDIIDIVDESGDGLIDIDEFVECIDELRPALEFARVAPSGPDWAKFRVEQRAKISANHTARLAVKEEERRLEAMRQFLIELTVNFDGEELALKVFDDATLSDLKQELARMTMVPEGQQELELDGTKLISGQRQLKQMNVVSGSVINMTVVDPLYFHRKKCHKLVSLSGEDSLRPDTATDDPGVGHSEPVKVFGGALCAATFVEGRHNWVIKVLATGDGNFFAGVCLPFADPSCTIVRNQWANKDPEGW
eukprot:Hpha_TRINITY_DN15776_c0_g1::TRINITY_DN15776_c0_g1_i2::g.38669::m.38669